MAWTDEQKQKAIDTYVSKNPTPENSTEIIKEIADEMEQTPNGVRMILIQAKVYVKKAESEAPSKTSGKTAEAGAKAPRVSKESQIAALKDAIVAKGLEADDEILSKLTGKAAVYLLKVVQA